MNRTRRLFLLAVAALWASHILALCRCSKPSSPSTGSVTGTVTVENQANFEGVTVTLYVPAEIDQELSQIQSLHPVVGFSIGQKAMFDHRLANQMATTETADDGSYSFENVPQGSFVVVAEREHFGYLVRFDVTVKSGSKAVVPSIDLLEEQELAGNLATNTTLEANRHYVVSSDVTVPPGVTLTIEPGAHIEFDGYHSLLVNGRLAATGTEDQMIVFTSRKEAPAPGDWRRIEFNSSADESEMRWCKIEYASNGIYAKGVPLTLGHNLVRNNEQSGILILSAFDTPIEIRNHLLMNNDTGIWLENVDNGSIECNIVWDNNDVGIGCQDGAPSLRNNLSRGNAYGLYCVYYSHPDCRHALLTENNWAIACGGWSKPTFRLCNFVHNNSGGIFVFIPPNGAHAQPTVNFCNFDEQTILIHVVGGPQAANEFDIDATNNYWGGLSVDEIDRLILDKHDVTSDLAPYVGEVIYLPMETAEIDSAGLQ